MPRPLYTALLWSETLSPGFNTGPTVPAGFVWVVRDVVATPPALKTVLGALNGLVLATDSSQPIASFLSCWKPVGSAFHWEGRQVVDTGDTLRAEDLDGGGWQIRVTGYSLSTP